MRRRFGQRLAAVGVSTVLVTIGSVAAPTGARATGSCGSAPVIAGTASGTVDNQSNYDDWYQHTQTSGWRNISLHDSSGDATFTVWESNCNSVSCFQGEGQSDEYCIYYDPGTIYIRVEAVSSPAVYTLYVSNVPQCSDGFDDDHDGRIDSGDPGCESPSDWFEEGEVACNDLYDNDGDGFTDYPTDPGCENPTDTDESGTAPPKPLLGCDDGLDNDGDLKTDSADPGCEGPWDGDERGTIACDDGRDNEGDGLSDYPLDPSCTGPGDTSESGTGACEDGIDNDGDGKRDYPTDPGCSSAGDSSERGSVLPCDDGVDNDGDGYADYPNDTGCRDITDPNETTIP